MVRLKGEGEERFFPVRDLGTGDGIKLGTGSYLVFSRERSRYRRWDPVRYR